MTNMNTLKLVEIFNNTPSIASQLPVFIGNVEIAEHTMPCNLCGVTIFPKNVHGYVSTPLPNVVSFHSVGVCTPCEHITESVVRIRQLSDSNFRYEKIDHHGRWVHADMSIKKPNKFWVLIKKFFR